MADYTIAAMYFLNKKKSWFADSVVEDVKAGRWGAQVIRQNDYRLINQVLLIIGLGDIGSVVAKKANALGIKVLAYDEFQDAEEMAVKGAEKVSWEEGFKRADYVSVNLKGVEANRNKITFKDFQMMKPSAYLINTARGKIVKEDDMIKAVEERVISGAVLDVILNEPPTADDPILHVDRIWITPHVSYITYESFEALKRFAIFNLTAMIRGTEPRDPVV